MQRAHKRGIFRRVREEMGRWGVRGGGDAESR